MISVMELILKQKKSMTDEEFVLDNKKNVVRADRGRSYVEIDGILYWKRGLDGKHRNRNNYMQFAMTPEDGKKYVVYYPEGFKDNDL